MQEHTVNHFQQWVESTLKKSVLKKNHSDEQAIISEWQSLPGDAGTRQYFRVKSNDNSWIAVRYSPESEPKQEIEHFCQLADYFRSKGVHTPSVKVVDAAQGFLILEDLGVLHYQDRLNQNNAETYYQSAIGSLLNIQQCPPSELFPAYSRERLMMELNLFREWFVGKMLGHKISATEKDLLNDTFGLLVETALEQPQVVVHRDYHSRNLICRNGHAPGVIDFQDALFGPITYDLVSLLRDCYLRWPGDKVNHWALLYKRSAEDTGVVKGVSDQQFMHWFDLMGMQRHLKVLGIFSRLSLRDNKHRYLDDLPRVINYVREISAKYGALSVFNDWFENILTPLTENKAWMHNAL